MGFAPHAGLESGQAGTAALGPDLSRRVIVSDRSGHSCARDRTLATAGLKAEQTLLWLAHRGPRVLEADAPEVAVPADVGNGAVVSFLWRRTGATDPFQTVAVFRCGRPVAAKTT